MNQIKIGDKYTFGSWGLLLQPSPIIGIPEVKDNYIDIPTGDGSIDLTEALTGEVHYGNRPLSFDFTLMPPRKDWNRLVTEITSYLHGRKHIIRMPDEPQYYFVGRVKVDSFKIDGPVGILEMSATCDPYKYKNNLSIYDLVIGSTGKLVVDCKNGRKNVIPLFTTNKEINVEFNGGSYSASSGTFKLTSVFFKEGSNQLVIKGDPGTKVKIEYQEGEI